MPEREAAVAPITEPPAIFDIACRVCDGNPRGLATASALRNWFGQHLACESAVVDFEVVVPLATIIPRDRDDLLSSLPPNMRRREAPDLPASGDYVRPGTVAWGAWVQQARDLGLRQVGACQVRTVDQARMTAAIGGLAVPSDFKPPPEKVDSSTPVDDTVETDQRETTDA